MKNTQGESAAESPVQRHWSPFNIPYVRFRPLPVVLTVITICLMIGLGYHIIQRFRATQLVSYSHLADIYVNRFLAPFALDLTRGEPPDPERTQEIARLVDPGLRPKQRIAMHIWGMDGSLLFTSLPSADVTRHDDTELRLAMTGKEVALIEERTTTDDGAPLPSPYLEIYLPIRSPGDNQIIAVGELYLDATTVMEDIRSFERTVMLATGLATLAVLFMLATSARESERLRHHLDSERRLGLQNARLRQEADQARLNANRANEETLNLVGAELHDGPVQVLSLAALMTQDVQAGPPEAGPSQAALIRQAMGQLRELSAGLILPEIEPLDVNGVVALAVDRFRALSSAPLRVRCPPMTLQVDLPRRICLYRVIQEGLTNAARHGDGSSIRLDVHNRGNALSVTLISRHRAHMAKPGKGPTSQLGLQAMRRRLESFGGTVVLREIGPAAVLQVSLPLS